MIRKHTLGEFKLGWLVGNFEPSIFRNDVVEVGIKHFVKGDFEPSHMQKTATEITVVIYGEIMINDTKYVKDDVIVIGPGESANFESLTASTVVCIKSPSIPEDKVLT